MKKTVVITLDYLPQTGGVANYWAGLNKYLPADLFYILAPQIKNYTDKEENILRKKILYDFFWPKWLKLFFIILKLQKKYYFEVFIAAQVLPIGTVLWFLKKTKLIKKYFISCHGYDILQLQGRKKVLAKKILKDADMIIANSNFTSSLIQKFSISPSKIKIITPCPNIKINKLAFSSKLNENNLNYKIITTARLVPRKGIDTMILAMPYIWEKFPQTVYTIVGAGNDLMRLSNIASNIDKNKIKFMGSISDMELANLYQQQDLFVMLPRNIKGDIEGFGMVFLEAGLFYLPVLATNSGGVSEAVKDQITGILIAEDLSPERVAKKVIDLFLHPGLLKQYGLNNHHWAQSFSWKKQANKLEEILI